MTGTKVSGTHSALFFTVNRLEQPATDARSCAVRGAQPSTRPVRGSGSNGLLPGLHWQERLYRATLRSSAHSVLGRSLQCRSAMHASYTKLCIK